MSDEPKYLTATEAERSSQEFYIKLAKAFYETYDVPTPEEFIDRIYQKLKKMADSPQAPERDKS